MSMRHVFDVYAEGTTWVINHHSPGLSFGPWIKATKAAAVEYAKAMARWVSGTARLLSDGEVVEEEWDYR
jgi:hypothetical protein